MKHLGLTRGTTSIGSSIGFIRIGNSPGDDHEGVATTPGAVSTARQGIPQGSAASPFVAEAMIAIALKQMPTLAVLIVAYADNILLLAKTKNDRDSTTKALLAAFKAHPVGRLRLSPRRFAPGEPIEFLGHRLTPCKGDVRIEVSDSNKRKFQDKMNLMLRSLAKTEQSKARRKALHEMKKDIESRAAAFALCDDIKKIRSYWLQRVHEQFKAGPDSVFEEKETMNNTVYKTFKLHPDQKEIVEGALKLVKDKTGTTVDTVALELICQDFMGSGIPTMSLDQALNMEFKKAGNTEAFLETLIAKVEKITGETLEVTIVDKDEAAVS